MKHIKRQLKIIPLVLVLLIGAGSTVFATSDEDYEANAQYYKDLCSGYYSKENEAECEGYRDYLNRKYTNKEEALEEIEANREKIKKDLASNMSLIGEYREKISGFESEVQALEGTIAYKESEIKTLESNIETHKSEIRELEKDVMEYMVNSQSTMRVNGYIEFIMNSNDFADVVRRVEGMNAIKRHNAVVVDALRVERTKLEESQEVLRLESEDLELQKLNVVNEQEKAQLYEKELVNIYAELEKQSEVLEMASAEVQNEVTVNQNLLDEFGEVELPPVEPDPVDPEDGGNNEGNNGGENGGNNGGQGIVRPVPEGRLTETVWYYSNSNIVHLGNDVGVDVGTPVYSIGKGVVVVTTGGCSTWDSWYCNGGMGNHVATIFEYNGTIYGSLTLHLQQSSFQVSPGTVVQAGQTMAYSGNSGMSTGPHVHVEIFYLGDDSVPAALQRWNESQRTAQFGLGGSSGGLSSTCDSKGWAYPCRMDPGQFVY